MTALAPSGWDISSQTSSGRHSRTNRDPLVEAAAPPLARSSESIELEECIERVKIGLGNEIDVKCLALRLTGEHQIVLGAKPSSALTSAANWLELAEAVYPDARPMPVEERRAFDAIVAKMPGRVLGVLRKRDRR